MANLRDEEEARGGNEAPREEQTKRQERANRILDAAGELLLRWGYKKTTIDDIAKQAGVAKGTIYLHWKTREDLFFALIARERLRLGQRYLQDTREHPELATLSGLTRYSILALQNDPLLKAVFLQDTDVFGNLLQNIDVSQLDVAGRVKANEMYFSFLRDKGLIRSDMDYKKLIHMFSAVVMGFLLIDRYLPRDFQISHEELADQAAEAVHRIIELRKPDADDLRATIENFDETVKTLFEIQEKELER